MEKHNLKHKIFIDNKLVDNRKGNVQAICGGLLELSVSSGDTIRLEPFTENKGDYTDYYHGHEYTVVKVVKVVKETWNSSVYHSIEVYLKSEHIYQIREET